MLRPVHWKRTREYHVGLAIAVLWLLCYVMLVYFRRRRRIAGARAPPTRDELLPSLYFRRLRLLCLWTPHTMQRGLGAWRVMAALAVVGIVAGGGVSAARSAPMSRVPNAAPALPLPTAPQLAYQQDEIMALIHFNMATFFRNGTAPCWNTSAATRLCTLARCTHSLALPVCAGSSISSTHTLQRYIGVAMRSYR